MAPIAPIAQEPRLILTHVVADRYADLYADLYGVPLLALFDAVLTLTIPDTRLELI